MTQIIGVPIICSPALFYFPPFPFPTGTMLLSYNFSMVANATKNFSQKHKIGEGGSGHVYRVIYKSVVAANIILSMNMPMDRNNVNYEYGG
jgi:hypothetical protein